MIEWIIEALGWVIPVLIAITFHEAAHGYVAWRLGDPTAYQLGRVTFNPLKHIDPLGTVILPALLFLAKSPFLFGYAKPVPVNFMRLKNPKRDMVWVALAGPMTNVILAVLGLVALSGLSGLEITPFYRFLVDMLQKFYILNLVLAVFNMLPIPPLDGGRVLSGLLPDPWSRQFDGLEKYGMLVIVALMILIPMLTQYLGIPVRPFDTLVWGPAMWLGNQLIIMFNTLGLVDFL